MDLKYSEGQRLNHRDHGTVNLGKGQVFQILRRCPSPVLAGSGMGLTRAPETAEGEQRNPEMGIGMFDGCDLVSHLHPDAQLLRNGALQSLRQALSTFHDTAGELPE
jgi:hypothetical protein